MRRIIVIASVLLIGILIAYFWLDSLRQNQTRHFHPIVVENPPPKAITDEECREFGIHVETAVRAGDANKVHELLRVDDMAYRIIHEVRLSARSREEWVNSVRNNTEGIPAVVTKCVKDGGKFTLLRAIPDKGNPRVVFRVVFATGGGPVIVFVSRGLEYVRPRLSSVVRASDLQTGWQSGSAPPSSP